ncbi:50S ribosome-binding GTPase [bacterium]|nr:50S ribosome-binding GTPase [bacterium]
MASPWRAIEKCGLFLEVLDARAPLSTTSLTFRHRFKGRPVIRFLMKSDLASPSANRAWVQRLGRDGSMVVAIDRNNRQQVREASAALTEWAKHKSPFRKIRASVVGIPNTGKSSLINAMVGRKKQETGDRPGVTRGVEWVRLVDGILLLDQPGVMGDDQVEMESYWRRVCCGTIPQGDWDPEEVAGHLVTYLDEKRRGWSDVLDLPGDTTGEGDFLDRLARRQGLLGRGGVLNRPAAARRLVDSYRKGRLGRISLEMPT